MPDGETTIFVYDAAGKQIAEYSNQVLPVEDAKVAYLTADHLGSPRINTDRDGNVTARHDYHPFGEEILMASTGQRAAALGYDADSIRKKFTGYERDDETELEFAQARYLNSRQGRFSSPDVFSNDVDSAAPQSWNLYQYVRNFPLRYVDRSGRDIVIVVNGHDYKVTRSDDNSYVLQGNDGSNSTVVATEQIINRLSAHFDPVISKLVDDKKFTSYITVNDDASSASALTVANSDLKTTTSDVGVSGNNKESVLNLGTEILVADELKNGSPFKNTSQTDDAPNGLDMVAGFGTDPTNAVPNAALARDNLTARMNNRVRRAFGWEEIDLHTGRYHHIDFDLSGGPVGVQQEGRGGGGGPLKAPTPPAEPQGPAPPDPKKKH